MEILRTLADLSIRRACGFAALGIGTVMLGLSYDLVLSFRSGAILTSIVCGVIWLRAWISPWRDIRDTEMWMLLAHERRHLTRGPDAGRVAEAAGAVLRERLIWHAERVALAAFALWLCTGLAAVLTHLLGG